MIPISACYTSGRGAPHFLGLGRCTISLYQSMVRSCVPAGANMLRPAGVSALYIQFLHSSSMLQDPGERWPSGLGSRPATGRSMVRVPLR